MAQYKTEIYSTSLFVFVVDLAFLFDLDDVCQVGWRQHLFQSLAVLQTVEYQCEPIRLEELVWYRPLLGPVPWRRK